MVLYNFAPIYLCHGTPHACGGASSWLRLQTSASSILEQLPTRWSKGHRPLISGRGVERLPIQGKREDARADVACACGREPAEETKLQSLILKHKGCPGITEPLSQTPLTLAHGLI